VAPQSRAEAIAKIRALVQAGRATVLPRVQKKLWGGHTVEDVEDCLCELETSDCKGDGEPDRAPHHPELPVDAWVYEFEKDFKGDRIYVKVVVSAEELAVLSFWFKGRAE
jgi:hypothetical protein